MRADGSPRSSTTVTDARLTRCTTARTSPHDGTPGTDPAGTDAGATERSPAVTGWPSTAARPRPNRPVGSSFYAFRAGPWQPRRPRCTSPARLPHLPGQAPRRRPGRVHPPPHQGAGRPRPPRRGVRRPALPGARRAGADGGAAEPRHLQRPLPGPVPGVLGAEDLGRSRRGGPVLHGRLQRAAGLQRPGPARAPAPPGRVRPRPRQPEPRLRPPAHRAAAAHHRHAPPPDLQGPRARDGPRAERQQAPAGGPLVLVRQDAGPGRPPDAPHRGGERELHQRHPRRHGRGRRPHAPGARRRRPGPVPAAPRGGPRARPAHHHGSAPTSP